MAHSEPSALCGLARYYVFPRHSRINSARTLRANSMEKTAFPGSQRLAEVRCPADWCLPRIQR